MNIKGNKFAVFGLGKTGLSVCDFLLKNNCEIYVWDDNQTSLASLPKHDSLIIATPDTFPWGKCEALILSPGVPLTHPKPHHIVDLANKHNCRIICDIELLYHEYPQATYIGITGTNGKSTTTVLTNHILEAAGRETQAGGNLGIPALHLKPTHEGGYYVLELSSYQLDLMHDTHIHIAAMLNITPDHIERHGNLQGYIKAKTRIFSNQQEGDAAVVNIDDIHCLDIYKSLKQEGIRRVIPISICQEAPGGVSLIGNTLTNDIRGFIETYEISERPNLPGEHNSQNIAFAFALATLAGVEAETIIKAIASFSGLPHRMQHVTTINGTAFINDSKATNAEAASKALSCYDSVYWIAGGKAKEGGIDELTDFFPKISHAFLIGEAQDMFANSLEGNITYTKCDTLDNAVIAAYEQAQNDNKQQAVILLSPACASYDQFPNFEKRGDHFCKLVKELESTQTNNSN